MKKSKLLLLFTTSAAVICLGAILSCQRGSSPSNQPKLAVVFVSEIQEAELVDFLTFPARVVAKINTTVLSESEGIVAKLQTALGKSVRIHSQLMTLTHTDPIYQYAPVNVPAPISGVVSAVDISVGSHVVPGQKLLSIIDPSQVKIQFELPGQDLGEIKKETRGEFKVMNREKPVLVKVDGISPLVDPTTGTASVEMSVIQEGPQSSKNAGLAVGIQGQVTFKVNDHFGISIPVSSLFYKGNDPYVSVVYRENVQGKVQEKVRQVKVILGTKQRGNVEILQGLSSGVQLVERTSRFVADGDPVTVESAAASNNSNSSSKQ